MYIACNSHRTFYMEPDRVPLRYLQAVKDVMSERRPEVVHCFQTYDTVRLARGTPNFINAFR